MAERKRRRRLAMDKEKKLEQMVLKTYYDFSNPGSYGGLARLQKATGVPLKKLKAIMRKNLIYALHKPVRVNYGTNPTVANSIDHQWAADLADMKNLSKYNKGIKYLLTVVDVLNKYAWVVPMKNKTGAEQKRAFESILQEGRKPLGLQTDKGSEFFNKPFQEYLKERKINHFNTESDTKASVVERFNRMLKQRLFRALTANATLKYLDFLPALAKGYNASVHNATGMAPKNVTMYNDGQVWKKLYSKKLLGVPAARIRYPKFKVGDKVMLSTVPHVFKNGYLPGWTEEIFTVDRILDTPVPSYKIKEYDDTLIKGTFYEEELQKVDMGKADSFFRIEKVLKRKDGKALVSCKGWPSKYDSWVDAKSIIDL